MIFFVLSVVFVLCALATVMPLRAGAVCTPATHRARQALAVVCAACAMVGFSRFVRFVILNGHPIGLDVVVGQGCALVLATQALVLWRSLPLARAAAMALAAVCGLLALVALGRGVMSA